MLKYKATVKREFKLPWRKADLLISMIKWTRTSRLSMKISLSLLNVVLHVGYMFNVVSSERGSYVHARSEVRISNATFCA